VRAQAIGVERISPLDLRRWRELAAQAAEPNPFFEPEYVLPLARGVGELGAVQLLVVSEGDDWRACLPIHDGRFHHMPLPSVSAWRGHYLYGLLGTPLVDRERPAEALDALVSALLARRGIWFAGLDTVSLDGPLAPAIEGVLGTLRHPPIYLERYERAALRRRPQPTYLEESLSAKKRKELRRQRRRLCEALGGELEVVERADEDAAYDEFIALEAAGRMSERGTVLAADPGHARFFREMCREFAELGRLQIPSLCVAGRTVATQVNLVAGDTIYGIKIAYDEELAAYSPGIQLEIEMLAAFHERSDASLVDSCAAPNNVTFNRLWPDRRALATYVLRPPTLPGRAAGPLLAAAQAARDYRSRRKRSRSD
jgi:CelD/BcsL family acetyltransferase involved in cellulose biosynthesis